MDIKRLAAAAAFLIIGIGGLLWQIKILHTEFYYYKIGLICSVLIVMGIASLFMNLSDLSMEDENGQRENLSFSEMPTGWKVVVVVAVLAGIGQLAYFEFGAPIFW